MPGKILARLCVSAVFILSAIAPSRSLLGQGIAVTGVGPVNRSMGGAGTAAPLDAIGALHWNPGSISALPCNEMGFGVELLYADVRLGSSLGSTTSGHAGWSAVPTIGWVHHLEDTPLTIGLGVFAVAGFKNNLPRDLANPLLATAPLFASAEILQISPTVSCRLSDNFSVGVAPTITTITAIFDPLGPSVITPLPLEGQGNRMHFGGGFQVGAYYQGDNGINLGFTFKSKQWMEELDFLSSAGTINFNLDYPMILSLGLAYTGRENWVFAIDGRYFDYEHTDGFRELGWRSVFAGAVGVQYQMHEKLAVRAGYNFNQNPIQSGAVFTNAVSPLIQDQNVGAGATYRLTDNVDINLAYMYLINNSVTGALPTPPFPVGSTITNEIQAHSLIMGVNVRY